MGTLAKLGKEGDTKLIWDPENEDEVSAARNLFDDLKGKGYFAYSVKDGGEKNEVVDSFDPSIERIIMALPMQGG